MRWALLGVSALGCAGCFPSFEIDLPDISGSMSVFVATLGEPPLVFAESSTSGVRLAISGEPDTTLTVLTTTRTLGELTLAPGSVQLYDPRDDPSCDGARVPLGRPISLLEPRIVTLRGEEWVGSENAPDLHLLPLDLDLCFRRGGCVEQQHGVPLACRSDCGETADPDPPAEPEAPEPPRGDFSPRDPCTEGQAHFLGTLECALVATPCTNPPPPGQLVLTSSSGIEAVVMSLSEARDRADRGASLRLGPGRYPAPIGRWDAPDVELSGCGAIITTGGVAMSVSGSLRIEDVAFEHSGGGDVIFVDTGTLSLARVTFQGSFDGAVVAVTSSISIDHVAIDGRGSGRRGVECSGGRLFARHLAVRSLTEQALVLTDGCAADAAFVAATDVGRAGEDGVAVSTPGQVEASLRLEHALIDGTGRNGLLLEGRLDVEDAVIRGAPARGVIGFRPRAMAGQPSHATLLRVRIEGAAVGLDLNRCDGTAEDITMERVAAAINAAGARLTIRRMAASGTVFFGDIESTNNEVDFADLDLTGAGTGTGISLTDAQYSIRRARVRGFELGIHATESGGSIADADVSESKEGVWFVRTYLPVDVSRLSVSGADRCLWFEDGAEVDIDDVLLRGCGRGVSMSSAVENVTVVLRKLLMLEPEVGIEVVTFARPDPFSETPPSSLGLDGVIRRPRVAAFDASVCNVGQLLDRSLRVEGAARAFVTAP